MILVITLISTVIIGLVGCSSASTSPPIPETTPETEVGPQVGNLAPDFKFMNPGGKNISLSDLRGNSVMLNFWATWCGPCKVEMPLIQELSHDEEKAAEGLVLLTVNSGESADKVASFMNEHGFSFPVLLDTQGGITQAYNVRAIPTTFFIDRDGIIKDMKIGAFSSGAEIEQKLGKITE
jgi:peroxiredoxin